MLFLLELFRLGSKDGIPVPFHVHDKPAAPGGLLESFDKLAGAIRLGVIGIFPFTIGMVDDEAETRARVVNRGVLQHRMVAVTVPATYHRSPADELMNAHRLSLLVVDE